MLKPLYDIVIIEPKKAPERSGAIFMPTSTQQSVNEGVAVAVGPGSRDVNGNFVTPQVKIGDVVIFNPGRVREISDDGRDYLMTNLSEVLAVRED